MESNDSCDVPCTNLCSRSLSFTGVLVAEIASLISSNFFTTVVAADFRLFKPPSIISFDFFPVKLVGLKQMFSMKAEENGMCVDRNETSAVRVIKDFAWSSFC